MKENTYFETSEVGNYAFSYCSFTENKAIYISIYNNQYQYSLHVSNCYFLKCFKEVGSSIFYFSSSLDDNVIIEKTCGSFCYLTKENSYGLFYSLFANQNINLISYYGYEYQNSIRDVLNHENGIQHLSHVNISHNKLEYRAFAYLNVRENTSPTIKYSISYNNTANQCHIIFIDHKEDLNEILAANIIGMQFIKCKSMDISQYFIESCAPFTTLIECSFVDCFSYYYFNNNFIFIQCFSDNLSIFVNHESQTYKERKDFSIMPVTFLDSFICEAFHSNSCKTCKKNNFLKLFSLKFLLINLFCPLSI